MRRAVLVMTVSVVCGGAGSAVLAAPAVAGQVDPNNGGLLSAAVYNATPYRMTLVAVGAPNPPNSGSGGWQTSPMQTIPPGQSSLFQLNPYEADGGGICFTNYRYWFDAYFTYRVDVLGGPPEYQTIAIWGTETHGPCFGGDGHPAVAVYDTTAPPPPGYDPASGNVPAPLTANNQITYLHNTPQLFDQLFTAQGNWTIDATQNATSASMADVLNSLCSQAASTSCSFTQMGPLTWGIGAPGTPQQATNCAAPGSGSNYFTITYDAAQSASLTVGAGITVSTELNLFEVIASEASVSVEGEQEWEDVQTFSRSTTAYIPPRDIASIFVVPVQAKVTGTLVVSNASATYTITNFSEQRSGVPTSSLAGVNPPTDTLSPAFNALTKVRPMTAAELSSHCHIGATRELGASSVKPPVGLVPGQGVAGVKLGQTQAEVSRELGAPLAKHFAAHPCRRLDRRCYAVSGTGGSWSYRQLSVVFGPDLRVSALIYGGPKLTAQGAGVGSTPAGVRAAFPSIVCSRHARRTDCTLTRVHGAWTVKTMFRLTKLKGGRLECRQVLIYVIHDNSAQVKA